MENKQKANIKTQKQKQPQNQISKYDQEFALEQQKQWKQAPKDMDQKKREVQNHKDIELANEYGVQYAKHVNQVKQQRKDVELGKDQTHGNAKKNAMNYEFLKNDSNRFEK